MKKIGCCENILGQKISRKLAKNSSQQVSEMEAFDEKILGRKIGVEILRGKWVKWKQSVKQFWVEKLL